MGISNEPFSPFRDSQSERCTMNQKTLVEVSVPDSDGKMVPYGIMNSEQAAELPSTYEIFVAHPGRQIEVSNDREEPELLA